MFGFVLTLVLVWIVLGVVLYVGTMWFQGTIYSEPAEQLFWRAPVAATALAGFVALYCVLHYNSPDNFDSFQDVRPTQPETFETFQAVQEGKPPVRYKKDEGRKQYFQVDNPRQPFRRESDGLVVKEIVVEETAPDGSKKEVRFKADLTADGKFKGEEARYLEEGGKRVMTETYLGQVSTSRWGVVFLNFFLALVHLGLWFVCLWLLLRYQWAHALGLAVVFWLVATLVVLPMLFAQAREVAKRRAAEQTALTCPCQPEARMCMMSPSLTT